MKDIDRLKKELDGITKELASPKKGNRAYKALEKAEVEFQLIGAGAIAQGDITVAPGLFG